MRKTAKTHGKRKYTLVLGGGAHLGAVQAGQLHALAEAGIEIEKIIGVSVGALNGSWVSRGLDPQNTKQLIEIWKDASNSQLFDRGVRRFIRVIMGEGGLSSNAKLREFAEVACPAERLENFPVPTEVVTCNLTTGCVNYHQTGPAVDLIVASCSMPGVFPPVPIDGERHVDGGVLDLLPWRRAGEDHTLVLDCRGGRRGGFADGGTALSVLLNSFALARHHRAYEGLESAGNVRLVPGPELGKDTSLRHASNVIDESYKITKDFLDSGGLEGGVEPKRSWVHRMRRAGKNREGGR